MGGAAEAGRRGDHVRHKLDLTHAVLPSGVTDFEIRAVMASIKVIVPPGVRVIVDTHSVMANVRSRADEFDADVPPSPTAPVIRITGFALMADVNVVVRRREDPVYDDDELRRAVAHRDRDSGEITDRRGHDGRTRNRDQKFFSKHSARHSRHPERL